MSEQPIDATQTLLAHTEGDEKAADELTPQIYDQLRRLAGSYMQGERGDHTLQATALVNEAYLKLIDVNRVDWQGRSHFFAMAALQMNRVLVEHARKRNARKRGGDLQRVSLPEDVAGADFPVDAFDVHRAIEKLMKTRPRLAQVACYRVAGMSEREIGHVLGIAERTVRKDWNLAKVQLYRELSAEAD